MTFRVVKTYPHSLGLSACFRQWRAQSHCRFLHGYALEVQLTFRCDILDENNWVIDFGSLKPVKAQLEKMFDHQTIVAADDPHLSLYKTMDEVGLCQLRVVENTGCEAFAAEIYQWISIWLPQSFKDRGGIIECVKVNEHGGNAAAYSRP